MDIIKVSNIDQLKEHDPNYPHLEFNEEVYRQITRQGSAPICPFCENRMSYHKVAGEYYCQHKDCTKKDWR